MRCGIGRDCNGAESVRLPNSFLHIHPPHIVSRDPKDASTPATSTRRPTRGRDTYGARRAGRCADEGRGRTHGPGTSTLLDVGWLDSRSVRQARALSRDTKRGDGGQRSDGGDEEEVGEDADAEGEADEEPPARGRETQEVAVGSQLNWTLTDRSR